MPRQSSNNNKKKANKKRNNRRRAPSQPSNVQHPPREPSGGIAIVNYPTNQLEEQEWCQAVKHMLQGKSLEEQDQLIQECAMAADPEIRDRFLTKILQVHFFMAPYSETFFNALAAGENQEFRVSADYHWMAFTTATSQSLWSPGRIFMFTRYQSLLHQNKSLLLKKDYRRLKRVIYDPEELSFMRLMASATCLSHPNSRYLSPESKMEILRNALLIESKLDEPFHKLQISRMRAVYCGQDAHEVFERSVVAVTEFAKHYVAVPGQLAGEVVAIEEDAELFRRTCEIAGGKCDGCHKTVQELGGTCLPKCGRCELAYYCNKRCQKRGWKRCGHKEVCRPRKSRAVGDVMRICDHQHEQHGRLVRLFEYAGMNERMEDDWNVTLFAEREDGEDMSTVFSINSSSLVHLRPLNDGEETGTLLNTTSSKYGALEFFLGIFSGARQQREHQVLYLSLCPLLLLLLMCYIVTTRDIFLLSYIRILCMTNSTH